MRLLFLTTLFVLAMAGMAFAYECSDESTELIYDDIINENFVISYICDNEKKNIFATVPQETSIKKLVEIISGKSCFVLFKETPNEVFICQ